MFSSASLTGLLAATACYAFPASSSPAQALTRRADLDTLCTPSNIATLVSAFSDLNAVTYHTSAITANVISNHTTTPSTTGPMWRTVTGRELCNVTLTMSHNNLDDSVCQ
jgi:hypothetical protein